MYNSTRFRRALTARVFILAALAALAALLTSGCGGRVETGSGGAGSTSSTGAVSSSSGDMSMDPVPHEECFDFPQGSACPSRNDAMNKLKHTCDALIVSDGTYNEAKQGCCYMVLTLPMGCGG